ncbi:MAG TPA: SUMF1/EgtB/PvdO family nonheme iron enzyme [Polyangiaceae bacterium]|nr:SUMF1/EgtB/PvdO family nonheme iron enzyme [Polyangiaceae bacterium]
MAQARIPAILVASAAAGSVALFARAEDAPAAIVEVGGGGGAPTTQESQDAPPSACPDGMVLVEGEWCPRVEQRCLRWMDPPGRFHEYRCAEYARPARCLAPRAHKRFCIDRSERADAGTGLPYSRQSWNDTKQTCEAAGARVCEDSEWTFACEGEELRPYPYGWARAADKCNADHLDLLVPGDRRRLLDLRAKAGSHPDCVSPFGLLDMAGNVAEWVSVDGYPAGTYVVQKGNWWQPGKHACRDEQAGHDRVYRGLETGFRCCADAR